MEKQSIIELNKDIDLEQLTKDIDDTLESFIDNLGDGGMDVSYSGRAVESSKETATVAILTAIQKAFKKTFINTK